MWIMYSGIGLVLLHLRWPEQRDSIGWIKLELSYLFVRGTMKNQIEGVIVIEEEIG